MSLHLDDRGLIVPDRRPRIPDAPATVGHVLDRPVAESPRTEALVGRHRRYTFAELDDAAGRAAGALAALGVGPGDRVAASLDNHPDIVVAMLGAMRLGAIWVGVNTALAPPEKAYMLRDCGVSVFLGDATTGAHVNDRSSLPELHHVVEVHADGTGEWHERLAAAEAMAARVDDPHLPAAIAYTSGTTGFPKGAVHTHHNLLLVGAVTRARGTYDPELRHGVCLPLTILNLMVLGPLTTIQIGAALVCMDRVDPVGMAEWIRDERIGSFSAVPAMVHGLLTHPEVTDDHLRPLVRPGVGGADLPETFRTMYRERFGAEVTIGYGLTEAPTAVTQTDPHSPPIAGEAGVALPQVEVVIVDDHDHEVPPGVVGEICVRPRSAGPWAGIYTPMLGYWNRPEATSEALRGGMLHTGDLGLLDEAGHLFVKDRRNDLIVRGGANVYPAEVERVLHMDPGVEACAVLGYPDERLGERVAAVVQARAGATVDPDALAAHCGVNLARYKVPDRWIVVDSVPRTPMGKIRRSELKQLL